MALNTRNAMVVKTRENTKAATSLLTVNVGRIYTDVASPDGNAI